MNFKKYNIDSEKSANDSKYYLSIFKKYLGNTWLAVALAAGISAGYFYNELSRIKNDPSKLVKEETSKLMAKISRHIVLPEGETPTMATVTDPEKLKNQPFFAKAKTGNKLLIYANAKKALLYDVENDKIVEVAPISIGTPAPKPTDQGDSGQ